MEKKAIRASIRRSIAAFFRRVEAGSFSTASIAI